MAALAIAVVIMEDLLIMAAAVLVIMEEAPATVTVTETAQLLEVIFSSVVVIGIFSGDTRIAGIDIIVAGRDIFVVMEVDTEVIGVIIEHDA
ncbi:hypothetical protein [Nitrosomonas mobilis]|uniref:Uncharacterized protein n=1 Tax=Nitrosomonas mobilis TaxID=51642 RepID=A0A1G5SHP6_9PROT|nr:hypothetical protein [Nitrosomonas mobilis]SCZ86648.1 hypothetical protein NSMM_630009 [Nitrosomonas mobilis]